MKNLYKLITSVNIAVEIDDDDLIKFEKGAATGSFMRFKRAIINPSFVVIIIPKDNEPQKIIQGQIDEKNRTFKISKEETKEVVLQDEFKKPYPDL